MTTYGNQEVRKGEKEGFRPSSLVAVVVSSYVEESGMFVFP
jgi:hypothetical protein